MKRLAIVVVMMVLLGVGSARAQQPTFAQIGGGSALQPCCSGAPQYGQAMWCFDNSSCSTHNVYAWTGAAWVLNDLQVISWSGDLGTLGNTAVDALVAPCTGHFTSLTCTATLTGACTTGPTINVTNITASTSGTSVSPTTTVATLATAAQTLVFTVGNSIGMSQTATTSTCTVPRYACNATYNCP